MSSATPSTAARKIQVILNGRAGTAQQMGSTELAERLREHLGGDVTVTTLEKGGDLAALAADAAKSDAEIIVAAGGDGTISGVAAALANSGKALGVIPLGTFNFFARRLGLPLEIEAAAKTIVNGTIKEVNVGEVNGRVFLNKSSVGLYPLSIRYRESMYRKFGRNRLVALAAGARALLRRGHVMQLDLAPSEGGGGKYRTRFVFVCNNPQELERFNIRGQSCLGNDKLAVYVPEPLGIFRMLGLGIRMALGRMRDAAGYEAICASELTIDTDRPQVPVSIDGEASMMCTPLRYRVLVGGLRVIVPTAK